MPVRHSVIFVAFFVVAFLPCYFAGTGFPTIQSNSIQPFDYDCYGDSNGWSFVGINMRFGRFNYGQAKALDLALYSTKRDVLWQVLKGLVKRSN